MPIPKVTKPRLRKAAELALRERGYEVNQVQARGVRPGTRVEGIKDRVVLKIAVRSSLNREVSLLKNQSGSWRTVPHVDEVVVAAADADDASMVEVLRFRPRRRDRGIRQGRCGDGKSRKAQKRLQGPRFPIPR